MKNNRYSRALRVLKSTEVDDKIKSLNEMPTNHTKGLYSLNDPGFRVGQKDPQKVYYPDVDGNWPAGIPGTPGELEYVRPEGYWSGGSDWDTQVATDFSQDYLLNDPTGRSTSGLISDNGTVFSELPPNSEGFILGPVIDGFVPNHTSDAYTNIGYIQKDTRQFVLLARISGQWKSSLNGNYPVWGGTSTGFTSYNQNFTLEMAQWVRDKILNDKYTSKVPYFYSGGVPQVPQSPADCPNCPPGMYGGNGIGPRQFGSGGNPSVGTQQGPPKSGDAKDAGFPWEILGKTLKSLTGIEPGSILQFGARLLRSITDPIKYAGDYMFKGLPSGIQYLPNFTGAGPFGLPKIADMPGAVARWVTGGSSNPVSRVIDNTVQVVLGKNYATQYFTPDVTTAIKYAGPGGTVVAMPRTSGVTGIKNWFGSNVSRGFDFTKGIEQLVSTSETVASSRAGTTQVFKVDDVAKLNQLAQQGAKTAGYMDTLIKAVPFVGAGAAIADTSVRLSKGDYVGAVLGGISAIPGPIGWVGLSAQITADISGITDPKSVNNKQASWLMNSIVDGLPSDLSSVYLGMSYKMKGTLISEETSMRVKQKYLNNIQKALFDLGVPKNKNELARQQAIYLMLNGVNPGLISLIVKAIVGDEYTEDEKKYLNNDFKKLIALFSFIREEKEKKENKNVKESKEVLCENRERILRDIKKPYVLPEIPKQKYKMNFSGKYSSQNTPDKTASKLSDDLVATGNARGQKWRLQDKYWQGYETTERMNVIYDRVGHGEQYLERIIGENQRKVSWKNKEIQEHLNIIAHEKAMKEDNPNYESPFYKTLEEQETIEADKDPLFKKVSKKLKKEINYPDKPSKNGVPNEPPPEMVNGYHPNFGKKVDYYKKLDPESAKAMPLTGNPHIDKKVKAAAKKPK